MYVEIECQWNMDTPFFDVHSIKTLANPVLVDCKAFLVKKVFNDLTWFRSTITSSLHRGVNFACLTFLPNDREQQMNKKHESSR